MFWLLFAPLRWLRRLVFLFLLVIAVLVVVGLGVFQHAARPGAVPGRAAPPSPHGSGAPATPRPGGDRANGRLLPTGPTGHHGGVAEPDRTLTPGATDPRVTQADLSSTICRAGYTATVRPPLAYTGEVKRRLMARAHTTGPAGQWELDHLVPLKLGGDPGYTLDRDGLPANLWLEPWDGLGGAHAKDAVEDALHHAVCDHQVSLHAAQLAIATDWYTALGRLHVTATVNG